MITIFTIPKPFTDQHINVIQRNAISSWKKLGPKIQIILIGDDPGVKETAKEFAIEWYPDVEKNEFGTPLLNSAFSIAREKAHYETIVYVNADIIFLSDFIKALPRLPRKNSLTVGRRIDLDITEEIDFSNDSWEKMIRDRIKKSGKLHSFAGIDYFIFNKQLFKNLPAFAVGRVTWDNWVVRESRRVNKFTIDATRCITTIHENHGYSGNNIGSLRKTNPEALKNISFNKNRENVFTIEDCNWTLTENRIKRKYFFWIPFLKRYVKRILNI